MEIDVLIDTFVANWNRATSFGFWEDHLCVAVKHDEAYRYQLSREGDVVSNYNTIPAQEAVS
jgi:hypothetical protein